MSAPQAWLDKGYTEEDWERHEAVERAIEEMIRKVKESGLWQKHH